LLLGYGVFLMTFQVKPPAGFDVDAGFFDVSDSQMADIAAAPVWRRFPVQMMISHAGGPPWRPYIVPHISAGFAVRKFRWRSAEQMNTAALFTKLAMSRE
jgi:hypothetical protein